MAKQEITGKSPRQVQNWKEEWTGDGQFEETFCLAEINNQPEDYDGPPRLCSQYTRGESNRCYYHGGAEGSGSSPTPENLKDKFGNMTHGLTATRDNFYEYIEKGAANPDNQNAQAEWMKQMYDWIVEDWPKAYGIDLEEDPASAYDFHALAVEIVRAEHGEGYILREGEKHEKEVVRPDGSVGYEDTEHYLSDMMQRQRKLIMRLENQLGISRKERLKQETASDANDVIKDFAEMGKAMLDPDNHSYDADEFA